MRELAGIVALFTGVWPAAVEASFGIEHRRHATA